VAEVSAIQFLDKEGKVYPATDVNYFNAALGMHREGTLPSLKKLSGMDVNEASRIIEEYQRRLTK